MFYNSIYDSITVAIVFLPKFVYVKIKVSIIFVKARILKGGPHT